MAIERQQRRWSKCAEDDGRRALGESHGLLRTELKVYDDDEEGCEDEVDWRGEGLPVSHDAGVQYGFCIGMNSVLAALLTPRRERRRSLNGKSAGGHKALYTRLEEIPESIISNP